MCHGPQQRDRCKADHAALARVGDLLLDLDDAVYDVGNMISGDDAFLDEEKDESLTQHQGRLAVGIGNKVHPRP